MQKTKQLQLAGLIIKQAGRGEFALGLLQHTPQHMLEKVTNPRAASEISQFSRLPNPLSKPPVFPANQLRSDWQPAFTKTAPPTLSSFLLPGAPTSHGSEWINQQKRNALARIISGVRAARAGVNKIASRGDYAADALSQFRHDDPVWDNIKQPGFEQYIKQHLPERDLSRLNGFARLTPAVDVASLGARSIRKLPNDAATGLASQLRLLRTARRFTLPRL